MKLNASVAAVLLLAGVSSSQAMVTQDLGTYTVSYDETTSFGGLSGTYGTSNGFGVVNGFNWVVPSSVQVVNSDPGTSPLVTASFQLPSLTITVDSGYMLNGPLNAFMGNLSYVAFNGATTSILASADVSVNGGPAVSLSAGSFDSTQTSPGPFAFGYLFGNAAIPVTGVTSIQLTNITITLSAAGGTFGAIFAQPQNLLDFSVAAVPTSPVPEPHGWALMLGGLGMFAWARRRLQR